MNMRASELGKFLYVHIKELLFLSICWSLRYFGTNDIIPNVPSTLLKAFFFWGGGGALLATASVRQRTSELTLNVGVLGNASFVMREIVGRAKPMTKYL